MNKLSLKYLRTLAGYSQRELAQLIDISPSTINYLEHGYLKNGDRLFRKVRLKHARSIVVAINDSFRKQGIEYTIQISDIEWTIYQGNDVSIDNLVQFKHRQALELEKRRNSSRKNSHRTDQHIVGGSTGSEWDT